MNGTAIRTPDGGAVNAILASLFMNAATKYDGRCLQINVDMFNENLSRTFANNLAGLQVINFFHAQLN